MEPGGYQDSLSTIFPRGSKACFGRFSVLVDKLDSDSLVAVYKSDVEEEDSSEEETQLAGVVSTVIAQPWE